MGRRIRRVSLGDREMYVVSREASAYEGRSAAGTGMTADDPHSDYCLEHKDTSRATAAFRSVCARVEGARSVLELFGGSGWHSAQIQDLVKPERHRALDIDAYCVESIRMSLPEVEARVADSYVEAAGLPAGEWDWVHADFNRFSFMRYLAEGSRGRALREAVDGIFRGAGRYVTITDSAIFGVHRFQRNRDAYTAKFGAEIDGVGAYCRAAARRYHETYGFAVRHVVTWGATAGIFLLERGEAGSFQIAEESERLPVRILE